MQLSSHRLPSRAGAFGLRRSLRRRQPACVPSSRDEQSPDNLSAALAPLVDQLAGVQHQLGAMQQLQVVMQHQLAGVQQQQVVMQQQQVVMQQQLAGVQQQQAATLASTQRTEARLGLLFEENVRAVVAATFGGAYAESALVESLHDAARLLPLGKVAPEEIAEQASLALVDAELPRLLLLRCERAAFRKAERSGAVAAARCEAAGPWLDADGGVRVAAMEACLSACGDVALATLARKLRETVGKPREEQAALLRSRTGPGVACLLAASCPAATAGEDDLPGESFQLDTRGRTEFLKAGALLLDVGEIKSGLDYAAAVPQLGRALNALRWMAATCCGCDAACAQLVGRLFVPRSLVSAAAVDAQQAELALATYDFVLHVHAL
jgi:hypothetical protein